MGDDMASAVKISNYQRPVDLLNIAQRNRETERLPGEGRSFKEMFSRELADNRSLQFSRHASQRLFSRDISLDDEHLNRIADAVDRAAEKGSRETLILTDHVVLVVAVNNRTVVTAFDRDNLRDGVVTSIDSAVIL